MYTEFNLSYKHACIIIIFLFIADLVYKNLLKKVLIFLKVITD